MTNYIQLWTKKVLILLEYSSMLIGNAWQALFQVFTRIFFCTALLLCLGQPVNGRTLIASGSFGAVSTGHPEATKAAIRILERGGNAVDAAVAAGFVLAVVDPSNSGLGGDGFALLRNLDGTIQAFDAASPPPQNKDKGHCLIGLPTEPALLLHLHRLAGKRGLTEVMAPAINLAKRGFLVSSSLERLLESNLPHFEDSLARRRFTIDERPARAGERLVHPELAETLSVMAADGGSSFYKGTHAATLIKDMQARGANYCLDDLASFSPRAVTPFRLSIGRWELIGPPPPSSAVVVMWLVKALVRENLPDFSTSEKSKRTIDLLNHALETKYKHLASCLNSPWRFMALLESKRENSPEEKLEEEALSGLEETTHLVTWDKEGRIVSMTLTLGRHFGTRDFSPLGFFYNDEMRNFTKAVAKYPTNYPHSSGPISAKAPLIVLRDGTPILAIGGAGANRIITNLAIILAWFIQGRYTLPELIHAPRIAPKEPTGPAVEWASQDLAKRMVPTSDQIASLTVKPAGSDLFGLISAVASLDSALIAVGDYRRSGSAAALSRDPMQPRTWQIEMFSWQRKGIDKLVVADVIPSSRQVSTGWKYIGEPLPQQKLSPFGLGTTLRRRLNLLSPASAVMLWQKVRINPEAPADAPSPWNDPACWSRPEPLGPLEQKFLSKVPANLKGRALIDWLAVEIGHNIPYQKRPGRMSGEELLRLGSGDCSGKARLFQDIARARGIPCRLVGGIILRPGLLDKTHIWNEVWLDNHWESVCTTNHIRGTIPPNWLIMRYGNTSTLETPGRLLFRVKEITNSLPKIKPHKSIITSKSLSAPNYIKSGSENASKVNNQ